MPDASVTTEPSTSSDDQPRPRTSTRRNALRILAVLALVGLAVGTAVRAFGLSEGLLVAVAGVTPFIGAGYLLPILLGALGRSEPLVALGAAGLAIHAAWLAPLFVPDQPQAGNSRLTVLSANLEYGNADPAAIVELVRTNDVDVLSLQELTEDAMPGIEAAGLDQELPHRYVIPGPPTPAGSGIWSRYPLSEGTKLEPTRFHNLKVTVNAGPRQLTVVAAHPFPPVGAEGHQLWERDHATLRAALAEVDAPAIVAGDLNATPDHRPMWQLDDLGYVGAADRAGAGVVLTWPATGRIPPVLALDHVLLNGDIAVDGFERVKLPDTDHYAVLAELRY